MSSLSGHTAQGQIISTQNTRVPWKSLGTDIFAINNKHYLCIVNYQSKFMVMKQGEGFSTDNLIKLCNIIFLEYGIPSKIVLDAGTNIILEKFKCERPKQIHNRNI